MAANNVARIINEWVAQVSDDVKANRNEITTVAVAVAVAYKAQLPTSPVDRPEEWYLVNVFSAVEDVVHGINEFTVLDVVETLALIRSLWKIRYRSVHMPDSDAVLIYVRQVTQTPDPDLPGRYADILNAVKVTDFSRLISSIYTNLEETHGPVQ